MTVCFAEHIAHWKRLSREGSFSGCGHDKIIEVREYCDNTQIQARCRAQRRKEHSSKGTKSGGGERVRACFIKTKEGWMQLPGRKRGHQSQLMKAFLQ